MKIVPLKCQNCGASIELSVEKTVAFCPYCGIKMLIDDEKQRVEWSGRVEISGIPALDSLCRNAEAFIEIGDSHNAEKSIQMICQNYPHDYRGYYLAMRSKMQEYVASQPVKAVRAKYDVKQFTQLAPVLTDVCDLAMKTLHFSPDEKQAEIKDSVCGWLRSVKPVIQDAQAKASKYLELENYCTEQSSIVDQDIQELNHHASEDQRKRKHTTNLMIMSLLATFLGVLMINISIAFILLVLAGLTSMIIFVIRSIGLSGKIDMTIKEIQLAQEDKKKMRKINGQTDWPDDQCSLQYVIQIADVYDKFSEKVKASYENDKS
jgi:DNA-directed RNA polymerase subunit RPC12/RpoP